MGAMEGLGGFNKPTQEPANLSRLEAVTSSDYMRSQLAYFKDEVLVNHNDKAYSARLTLFRKGENAALCRLGNYWSICRLYDDNLRKEELTGHGIDWQIFEQTAVSTACISKVAALLAENLAFSFWLQGEDQLPAIERAIDSIFEDAGGRQSEQQELYYHQLQLQFSATSMGQKMREIRSLIGRTPSARLQTNAGLIRQLAADAFQASLRVQQTYLEDLADWDLQLPIFDREKIYNIRPLACYTKQ